MCERSRWFAGAMMILASCTTEPAPEPTPDPNPNAFCARAAAAPPGCVLHGLASVELSGTWHLTGTVTTTTHQPYAPTTTAPVAQGFELTVTGCTLQNGPMRAEFDDTSWRANNYLPSTGATTQTVCVAEDGTLRFHQSASWDRRARGGTNGSSETTGTLTR